MFPCTECPRSFEKKQGLRVHISIGHPELSKKMIADGKAEKSKNRRIPSSQQSQPSQSQPPQSQRSQPSSPTGASLPQARFECRVCSQCFDNRRGLLSHFTTHASAANTDRANRRLRPQDRQSGVTPTSTQAQPPQDGAQVNLPVIVEEFHQKFLNILRNIDNFDPSVFDQTVSSFLKFLFECNQHLPGPTHPSVKQFRLRRKKISPIANSQYKTSSNPQRTNARVRSRRNNQFEYELTQYFFKNYRKKAVSKIMGDPNLKKMCTIPMDALEGYFRNQFEMPNGFTLPEGYAQKPAELDIEVSIEDVETAIRRTSYDTSPGYDRVLARTIKDLKISRIVKTIIEIMLISSFTPTKLKEGKTIVCHKGGDPNDVKNWRPITIYPIVRRIIEKVLDQHLRKQIQLNCNQRGFTSGVPGAHANAAIINSCLQNARINKKDCSVIFLDISKAFDRIGHHHIEKCLAEQGVSKNLGKLIMSLLTDNSIKIDLGKSRSQPIQIRCSVPQGGPLSPILFNLATNFIFQEITEPGFADMHGYHLSPDLDAVSLTGFADDQAITASSTEKAIRIANNVESLFEKIGLQINPSKSQAIIINSGRATQTDIVLANGKQIKAIGPGERISYLGSSFENELVFDNTIVKTITDKLNLLAASPLLKGDQKLNIINQYIMPMLTFPLQAAPLRKIPQIDLTTLDINIRTSIKQIIGLPSSTATAMFYAPRKSRGLGVVNCEWEVALQHFAIASKLSAVPDQLLQASTDFRAEMAACKSLLNVDGDSSRAMREELRKKSKQDWDNLTFQGIGAAHFDECPLSNAWVHNKGILSCSEWTAAIKLNVNYANLAGVPGNSLHAESRHCRRCGSETETPSHVLGACSFGSLLRNARHHRVKNELARLLQEKDFDCFVEVPVQDDQGRNRFIDILAFDKKTDNAFIVDPTVRFETNGDVARAVQLEKATIYESCIPGLMQAYPQFGHRNYQVKGLWFGSRGTISTQVIQFCNVTGISIKDVAPMAERVLCDSIKMIHMHIYSQ